MAHEFSRLTMPQVQALPRLQTVFFFSTGPFEDHGPHLPIGLDAAEARALCELAARRLEADRPGWVGVLMPPVPLGIDANTTSLSIRVRAHVLRDWLVDSCRSLVKAGFFHFVCFSGHLGPRQLTAIEEAGKIISRRGKLQSLWGRIWKGASLARPTLVSASSGLISAADVRKTPVWSDPVEHGGRRDTSVGLFIANGDVAPSYLGLAAQPREGSHLSRGIRRMSSGLTGYWGSPAEAKPEEGERALGEMLNTLYPKMIAVWDGTDPNSVFRSWYSVIPMHKSFFRAWLIAFTLILLLSIWVYLNLQAMVGL